jgi:uncharacterized protein
MLFSFTQNKKRLLFPFLLLLVWIILYRYLRPAADWFIYDLAGLEKGKRLTESMRFFIFELPKVLL